MNLDLALYPKVYDFLHAGGRLSESQFAKVVANLRFNDRARQIGYELFVDRKTPVRIAEEHVVTRQYVAKIGKKIYKEILTTLGETGELEVTTDIPAVRRRKAPSAAQLTALARLGVIASGVHAQADIVAAFLLHLCYGLRVGFNLSQLRDLDALVFHDCLTVLELDHDFGEKHPLLGLIGKHTLDEILKVHPIR